MAAPNLLAARLEGLAISLASIAVFVKLPPGLLETRRLYLQDDLDNSSDPAFCASMEEMIEGIRRVEHHYEQLRKAVEQARKPPL